MADDAAQPRIELTAVSPEMWEPIYRWYQDPELVAPFDRYEPEDFESFVRSVEGAGSDPRSLAPRYAIVLRDGRQVVGCAGYYLAHPVLEYVDVWYLLGEPTARGRGYGREAVRALIGAVFAESPVERVGATCDADNAPSYRLLASLGLEREGTLRSALFHHGRWHDVYVYGTTRSAWARAVPSARASTAPGPGRD